MSTASLDIVFCFRNRDLQRVRHALDSLAHQSDPAFRVILVDYGSEDTLSEKLKDLCGKFSFCRYLFVNSRGKMWNRADALNHGIAESGADFVFTADADLVFYKDFVKQLKQLADTEVAKFFTVGYLDRASTRLLGSKAPESLKYTRSEDFALGMMLVAKQQLLKVNGYNSFYCLWGIEDNDMRYRLEQAGTRTDFINKVLMLHQYHAPANKEHEAVPRGWLQFMKDYHEDFKKHPRAFAGISQVHLQTNRPALQQAATSSSFTKLDYRHLYVRYRLITDVNAADSNAVLRYDVEFSPPLRSTVVRGSRFLNQLFQSIKIPLITESRYRSQHAERQTMLHNLYGIVKMLEPQLKDYSIEEKEQAFKVVLVKK